MNMLFVNISTRMNFTLTASMADDIEHCKQSWKSDIIMILQHCYVQYLPPALLQNQTKLFRDKIPQNTFYPSTIH